MAATKNQLISHTNRLPSVYRTTQNVSIVRVDEAATRFPPIVTTHLVKLACELPDELGLPPTRAFR